MSEDGELEDNINYKSICCEEIPELFLDKLVAKKHFSKFGKISRFILRPKRLSCTVEYENEEEAEKAYMEAGTFNGHDFVVNFAPYEVGHVQQTEEWVDPDVQSELEAMNPGYRSSTNSSASFGGNVGVASNKPSIPSRLVKPIAQRSTPPPYKEKTEIAVPIVPRIDNSVRIELETQLKKPALTDEDKYRVLDARDKLIRLKTVRQTDIKKAVSTKGICPDMCPEKERLMREFQRQVSNFEYDSSGSSISHYKAIKEYSRSSADQEVPLAHELRPESVLQMTMLYLMHRIMDLCNDSQTHLADWFHFVWDRTRSIRKDITQQELCSPAAVELVEQCARFHIHCAARLVAEDPSVFDKKINAENLTKCLQTLKYMYHDLRIKGIDCPCEAEFRSYIVLLNLGDANFLWELKQLPESIQKSAPIKRAIQFFNALQNNNYVRFFEMIRSEETSYLSACILLGYFNKLRVRALQVIIKSHNWRKNGVFLSIDYLTRILGFENADSTVQFLAYYGLDCDDSGRFMLQRLEIPDGEFAMERALKLVEQKRKVSVGECVCGHTLKSATIFENHQPHSSFDENGYLKPEAWTAEDQLRGEAALQKCNKPKAATTTASNVFAPIVKTDNIFKVPQASPPISPKQQQQQKWQQQQQQKVTPNIFGTAAATAAASSPSQNIFANVPKMNKTDEFAKAHNSYINSIFTPIERTTPSNSSSTNTMANTNIFANVSKMPASNNIFGGNAFGTTAAAADFKQDNIFQHFKSPNSNASPSNSSTGLFAQAVAAKPNVNQRDPRIQLEQQRQVEALALAEEHKRLQANLEAERAKLKELQQQKERERQEAKQREMQRLQQQKDNLIIKAENLNTQFLKDFINEELLKLATEQLNLYKALEARSLELTQQLIEDILMDEITEMAKEEYAFICHDQMILNRYFERWLQHTQRKKQQRLLMQSTPLWVSTETRAEQSQNLLHPSQNENLQLIKRYRHGAACDFKALLYQTNNEAQRKPLNLFSIIAHISFKPNLERVGLLQPLKFFKMIISLPLEMEELPGFESMCNNWMTKYIEKPPNHQSKAFLCYKQQQVALCIRKLSGINALNEQSVKVTTEGNNSDALILMLSCVNLQQTRKRLHRLLKFAHLNKPIPLAIIVFNGLNATAAEIMQALECENLLKNELICDYRIFGIGLAKADFRFEHLLEKAVKFAYAHKEKRKEQEKSLQMLSLQSFLHDTLGLELWQKWQISHNGNPAFAKVCCYPQHVVGIYNEALQRLSNIVGENFENEPEFPEELKEFVPPQECHRPLNLPYFPADWKNADRQNKIKNLLQNFKLPSPNNPNNYNPDDLQLWLLDYASKCLPENEETSTQIAYEAIKLLVHQMNQAHLLDLELKQRFECINFLDIIKIMAFSKANQVLSQLQNVPQQVIYRRQSLEDFKQQPWWLTYENVQVDYTLASHNESLQQCQQSSEAETIESIIQKAEKAARIAEQNLRALKKRPLDKSINHQTMELDESLYEFELAQKKGQFDLSTHVAKELLEEDCLGAVGGDLDVFNSSIAYASPPGRKRKRIDNQNEQHKENISNNSSSDMEKIMAKAFNLIEKVEMQELRQERLNKRMQKLNEFI